MNTKLTEIAFILDRSGSMADCVESAIAGFNEFLRQQKAQPGFARMTLVLFDDQYDVRCASIPLPEVTELDTTSFVPRGSTALLDAIGQTIDDLGARLSAMPESERPGQVIIPILTDGLENASQKYSWADISAKITHQSDAYKWVFLFLGANQDAIATAAHLGIAAANASGYQADAVGTRTTNSAMSRKLSAMRKSAAGSALDLQEAQDFAAPLSQIVQEEDRKGRDTPDGR